jgi:hypothetical protein
VRRSTPFGSACLRHHRGCGTPPIYQRIALGFDRISVCSQWSRNSTSGPDRRLCRLPSADRPACHRQDLSPSPFTSLPEIEVHAAQPPTDAGAPAKSDKDNRCRALAVRARGCSSCGPLSARFGATATHRSLGRPHLHVNAALSVVYRVSTDATRGVVALDTGDRRAHARGKLTGGELLTPGEEF